MKYRLCLELRKRDPRGQTGGGIAVHGTTERAISRAATAAIRRLVRECEADLRRRERRGRAK